MCNNRLGAWVPVGAVAAAMLMAGCATEIPMGQTSTSSGESVAPEEVLVRFHNFSESEAVDVEFFATNDPLDMLPDDLFQEVNRVTASIGIAGTGIVTPRRADAVTLPCTEHLMLGTIGGSFSDNETGEARGVGIMRWVQEGPLALCGHTVTFKYSPDGEEFLTVVEVGD